MKTYPEGTNCRTDWQSVPVDFQPPTPQDMRAGQSQLTVTIFSGTRSMPVHDWSRVFAGAFHDFHLAWMAELRNALNGGILPENYYALAEQAVS